MTSSVVSGREEAEKVRSQGNGKKIQELSLDPAQDQTSTIFTRLEDHSKALP
jgi:hypothetical protein